MAEELPTEIEVEIAGPSLDVVLTDPVAMAAGGMALDGDSVLVAIDGSDPAARTVVTEHGANLAEHLDEGELQRIASQIEEWVDEDRRSRAEWDDCLNDGMETLGIAPLAEGDKLFKGASTVTHPIIAEAAVQFASRAMEELFPSGGPVKCKTVPGPTEEMLEQARRVEGFFNHYLTDVDEDYYEDSDQMLFILALHGHIFRKIYEDPITGEAKARFVTASNLLVPYTASGLKDADHYTQVFTMSLNDIRKAQRSGHFREVDLKEGSFGPPEQSAEQESKDESDRRSPNGVDDVPELYECHCNLVLGGLDEGGGIALPYIVTMERNTRQVLSIYRNWDPEDQRRLKQVWFASYKYLEGLGFYGLGLFHVLGNIAQSCGAILRAIIDAGAFSNVQGGFVAKQGGGRKLDITLEMGRWQEIDLSPEELKNAFHTPPFREPSQTLLLTLRALIEAAQRFSSTTEAMVGDAPSTGPVGTTMALIEQASKVFSAIHKRNHRSLKQELRCLVKLFRRRGVEYPYETGGSLQADLDNRVDITPVSDPTIVSNTQRIAMAQAAQQLVSAKPNLYGPENQRMVDLALLKTMKIPEAELIVKDYTEVQEMDPVSENMAILTGKPVKAFPGQHHDAHIEAHLTFFNALPPQGQKAVEAPGLAHIAEHAALKYRELIEKLIQSGIPAEAAMRMPLPPLVPQLMPPSQPNG